MIVHTMNFKVSGITLPNKDGKDPQTEIKRILKDYKRTGYIDETNLFNGYTNKEIKEDDLSVSEYEGMHFPFKLLQSKFDNEDCVEVYFIEDNKKETHIGYAPKNYVNELIEWFTKENVTHTMNMKIIGGKKKFVVETENDVGDIVDKVVTDELNYGAVISISFYDNSEQIKTTTQQNNATNKDSGKDGRGIAIGIIIFIFLVLIGIATNPQSFNNVSNEMNMTINEQNS